MSFDITDHVPGLTDEQVADIAAEAATGFALDDAHGEPNPHFQRVQLVPAELLDAIDERARQDGQSPDSVVREALATYLNIA